MNIYIHRGIFLNNIATLEYYKIVETSQKQNRKKLQKSAEGYTYYESHHILPKSIFPEYEYDKWNKVLLTAKEHLICHRLLLQMLVKGKAYYQMVRAYHSMAVRKTENMPRYELTPEEYEDLKLKFSEAQTSLGQKTCKDITKVRIGVANKGRKPSSEAVENSVKARLGKKRPTDAVIASTQAQIGNTNVRGKSWWNNGVKSTMSFACPGEGWSKGRIEFTEEHRKNIGISQLGNTKRKGKTVDDREAAGGSS